MKTFGVSLLFALSLYVVADPYPRSARETGSEAENSLIVDADAPQLARKRGVLFLESTPFTGVLVSYYPDGSIKRNEVYVDGMQDGAAMGWYPDGMPMHQRFYRSGKKDGIHTGWWNNGLVKFEYRFASGLHEGVAREWFEDGQPYREFNYEGGKEAGRQRMWYEDGTLRANYFVKNGRRYGLIGSKPCSNPVE